MSLYVMKQETIVVGPAKPYKYLYINKINCNNPLNICRKAVS